MHEEWDENYQRGYEWWLMKEAKMVTKQLLVFMGYGYGALNKVHIIATSALCSELCT